MKRILVSMFLVACGSAETTTSKSGLSDNAESCEAAKFDYCVDELKLGEAECDEKVALWCDSKDDDCFAGKFDHCVDVMGLDETTCEAKADAWCDGDGDCFAKKFDYCVDTLGLSEAECKTKADAWCDDADK